MTVRILKGDCLEVMVELIGESVQVDAVVTDPPYHLVSIYKRFAKTGGANRLPGAGPYQRHARGFMGKTWDGGEIAFQPETWHLCFDLLKPGGQMLVMGGTRTYHRMACAVEDAGFEVRDQIMWIYGQGFPKARDVSKEIDKAAGAKRQVLGAYESPENTHGLHSQNSRKLYGNYTGYIDGEPRPITAPATAAARQWEGWGTALKPAHEPILVARKPLSESTVAANVLKHGTGALNIDGGRIDVGETTVRHNHGGTGHPEKWRTGDGDDFISGSDRGRWPGNVTHDGSPEVMAAFARFGEKTSGRLEPHHAPERRKSGNVYGEYTGLKSTAPSFGGDTGSAARFFYCAKASKAERAGSKHPTVKPVALMCWLARLITPAGGVVLDPFAGSGTTGEACEREGFECILIEREAESIADIHRRLGRLRGTDTPLFAGVA